MKSHHHQQQQQQREKLNLHRSPITGRMIHLPPQQTTEPAPETKSESSKSKAKAKHKPPTAVTAFNNCTLFNLTNLKPSHDHNRQSHRHRQAVPLPHQQPWKPAQGAIHHHHSWSSVKHGAVAAYDNHTHSSSNNSQIHHTHTHTHPHKTNTKPKPKPARENPKSKKRVHFTPSVCMRETVREGAEARR